MSTAVTMGSLVGDGALTGVRLNLRVSSLVLHPYGNASTGPEGLTPFLPP